VWQERGGGVVLTRAKKMRKNDDNIITQTFVCVFVCGVLAKIVGNRMHERMSRLVCEYVHVCVCGSLCACVCGGGGGIWGC